MGSFSRCNIRFLYGKRFFNCYILLFIITIILLFLTLISQHEILNSPKCEHIETIEDCLKSLASICSKFITPTIYVATPTYKRPVQKAELTRLSYAFVQVPNLHWIIIEDSPNKTKLVANFLKKYKGKSTHLNVQTPEIFKLKQGEKNWKKPRGVLQRNKAIEWIIKYADKGVIYFADDDNTYDIELFQEMRGTRKVSIWPVGLVGGLMVERPLVKDGKVIDFNSLWNKNRPFPVDMASFAINIELFHQNPLAAFSINLPNGFQESHLLQKLGVSMSDLEPKAANCTQILVWHTRTELPKLKQETKLKIPSNLDIEV